MANTDIAYEEQEPSRDVMYLLNMKDSLFAVVFYFLQSEFLLCIGVEHGLLFLDT